MSANTWLIIAIVGFSLSALAFIAAVAMLIVLNIPAIIGDLTGRTVAREIKTIRDANASSGDKRYRSSAVNLERGTLTEKVKDINAGDIALAHISKRLDKTNDDSLAVTNIKKSGTASLTDVVQSKNVLAESESTVVLSTDSTVILSSQETEVLSCDATEVLDDNATEVLSDNPTEVLNSDATEILRANPTEALNSDATEILRANPTEALNSDATEVLSDNPTEALNNNATEVLRASPTEALNNNATEVLSDNPTEVLNSDATEVLRANPTEALNSDATEVLRANPTEALNNNATKALSNNNTEISDENVTEVLNQGLNRRGAASWNKNLSAETEVLSHGTKALSKEENQSGKFIIRRNEVVVHSNEVIE